MYIEKGKFFPGSDDELTFKRKISKSLENRAAVITVPRAIAQLCEKYESLDLIFMGTVW
jgi:putative aminopeptidase FrvX